MNTLKKILVIVRNTFTSRNDSTSMQFLKIFTKNSFTVSLTPSAGVYYIGIGKHK